MWARVAWLAVCLLSSAAATRAQEAGESEPTRAGLIADQQREKANNLEPHVPNRGEEIVRQIEQALTGSNRHWHGFFESAYRGGGFTLGAGYLQHVSDYNWIDLRGSGTIAGYLRFEGEFRAPRLFDRRGTLSVVGGWRKATEVGYYGLGTGNTSREDEAFYSFTLPQVTATLEVRPTRRYLALTGGGGYAAWQPGPGERGPSIEDGYTDDTAPGLGASPTYLHLFAGVSADSRPATGYARRGGFYGVTFNTFLDNDGQYGFRRVDYELVQHVPLGRDAWVLSLRGRAETTRTSGDEVVPYFMMPSLGGGSDLRGFSSWRFRDRNSLLLQAEWRVLVNAFFDTALFYDAGKVASRASDLDFTGLKSDYGVGFRIHGPTATPLRIDLAHSNEGFHLVFSAHAVF